MPCTLVQTQLERKEETTDRLRHDLAFISFNHLEKIEGWSSSVLDIAQKQYSPRFSPLSWGIIGKIKFSKVWIAAFASAFLQYARPSSIYEYTGWIWKWGVDRSHTSLFTTTPRPDWRSSAGVVGYTVHQTFFSASSVGNSQVAVDQKRTRSRGTNPSSKFLV